jgi:hypothetical protein
MAGACDVWLRYVFEGVFADACTKERALLLSWSSSQIARSRNGNRALAWNNACRCSMRSMSTISTAVASKAACKRFWILTQLC